MPDHEDGVRCPRAVHWQGVWPTTATTGLPAACAVRHTKPTIFPCRDVGSRRPSPVMTASQEATACRSPVRVANVLAPSSSAAPVKAERANPTPPAAPPPGSESGKGRGPSSEHVREMQEVACQRGFGLGADTLLATIGPCGCTARSRCGRRSRRPEEGSVVLHGVDARRPVRRVRPHRWGVLARPRRGDRAPRPDRDRRLPLRCLPAPRPIGPGGHGRRPRRR